MIRLDTQPKRNASWPSTSSFSFLWLGCERHVSQQAWTSMTSPSKTSSTSLPHPDQPVPPMPTLSSSNLPPLPVALPLLPLPVTTLTNSDQEGEMEPVGTSRAR
jgi:hypothetical protein